jgi:hypothetical protein
MIEGILDFGGTFRIPDLHGFHGGIGEHHTPTKGIIGTITLHHGDGVRWVKFLHQQSEIQPSWPATDTNNPHHIFSFVVPGPCNLPNISW